MVSDILSPSFSDISLAMVVSEAVVDSFLASDLIRAIIFLGSLLTPSNSVESDSHTDLMYSFRAIPASAPSSRSHGHPPLIDRRISSSRPVCLTSVLSNLPSKSPLRETEPSESPDSKRDMVRISRRPMRPVPLWSFSLSSSFEIENDPHRMNLPLPVARSTSNLTSSQSAGTFCHSSMRCGASPLSAMARSVLTASRTSLFSWISLEAWLRDAQVFPQPFGPLT